MRKLVFTTFLLLLLLTLPVCAHAWEWTIDSAGTLEITGTGPVEDFESASSTPWSGKTIKSVIIHEGITELGSYAFRNCTKLTSVTLPDSMVTLGISAFEGCSGLKTVTFGTGLQTVQQYVFQDCTALTGVYIRDLSSWCAVSYADYSSSPMYYAKALYVNGTLLGGELEIAPGVTKIPKYAFYGCSGITALRLPDSVKTIESDAFAYCSGLATVDLGDGVTTVGSAAFSYCNSLSYVTMGDRLVSFADYVFYNCDELESIELSAGLRQLGQRVFYGCTSLNAVHLPEGLSSMGSYAFYGCTGLQTVVIPESLTAISEYAFRGCSGLTELRLPETLTTIGKYAFYGCSGISVLTIPRNLTGLGNYAFYNCTGLTEIHYNAIALADLSAGNYVFYKAGKSGLVVTVDAGVARIPAYLFFPYSTYCPNVSSIIFEPGSNCTQIGKYAFAGCKSLQEVFFTGSMPTIDINAFNKVTARCYYPASWDSATLQKYGGTITWLPLVIEAADGTMFASFAEALNHSSQLRLLVDLKISALLQQDLYIDLNGYDLSGVLSGNYKIFGTDSTTDRYDGSSVGLFSCTDENGEIIIPEIQCKVDSKRYLAVQEEAGYSFHRFYMGVTHMTLRPGEQGVGFKAVFYGDEAVRSQIAAIGYTVTLGDKSPKSQWKNGAMESGAMVSMLIRNFDAEQYGETDLSAYLCIKLKDGTVIESGSATLTLRGLLERLNQTPELLNATHRTQLTQWAEKSPIIRTWEIPNLI